MIEEQLAEPEKAELPDLWSVAKINDPYGAEWAVMEGETCIVRLRSHADALRVAAHHNKPILKFVLARKDEY